MKHWLVVAYSRLMVVVARLVKTFFPQRMPVVFTGAGSAERLAQHIASAGCQRALVVTDKVLVQLGLVAKVTDAAEAAGVSCTVYDGILPDPASEQIAAGAAMLQQQAYDAVIAIGGGSALDAAKVIALQSKQSYTLAQLGGYFKVKEAGLPVYCVPTTAGTGSEATMVSVVTDSESQSKVMIVDPKITPQMAALDPLLMQGMPAAITAATGVDALTHSLESLLSELATNDTRYYASTAARLIFKHLPTACEDGSNLEAREALATASFLAGAAFTHTSVGYVHALAHQIGAIYHVPHGVANAVLLPKVLAWHQQHCPAKLAATARHAGIGKDGETDDALAVQLVESVRTLLAATAITPYFEKLRVEDFDNIIQRALTEAHGLYGYAVPYYMRAEDARAILEQVLPESPAA